MLKLLLGKAMFCITGAVIEVELQVVSCYKYLFPLLIRKGIIKVYWRNLAKISALAGLVKPDLFR